MRGKVWCWFRVGSGRSFIGCCGCCRSGSLRNSRDQGYHGEDRGYCYHCYHRDDRSVAEGAHGKGSQCAGAHLECAEHGGGGACVLIEGGKGEGCGIGIGETQKEQEKEEEGDRGGQTVLAGCGHRDKDDGDDRL